MPHIWESSQWSALVAHAPSLDSVHLRDLLSDAPRAASLRASFEGYTFDFSRQRMTTETLSLLLALADAAGLQSKIAALGAGSKINTTEGRAVLHMALRAPADARPLLLDGVTDVHADVRAVRAQIASFANKVRSGAHVGATGKPLTTVVSIGIGGSYLGVEFVYEALRKDSACSAAAAGRALRFLANVDPVDVARALEVRHFAPPPTCASTPQPNVPLPHPPFMSRVAIPRRRSS